MGSLFWNSHLSKNAYNCDVELTTKMLQASREVVLFVIMFVMFCLLIIKI